MKKMMMILVSAIMMSATTYAAEKLNVEPFEGVNVSAPVRVRFVYGEEYKVYVQSADSLAASAIRMDVKDGVLKISSPYEDESPDNVRVTVVSPVEPRLSVGRNMEVKDITPEARALAGK